MALLPVREIWSITPSTPLAPSPPAPWISAMATSSFVSSRLVSPRRDLVLVSVVACRRVVDAFPWLGAVVATRALPRHATVVSSPSPLFFSVLSWSLLWPCSTSQIIWGSSPSLLSCCGIRACCDVCDSSSVITSCPLILQFKLKNMCA
jgi:hypothetical protein